MLLYLVCLLVGLIIIFVTLEYFKVRAKVRGISRLLQSAAWNLVREMENNPVFTAKKYRNGIKADFEEIVVASLEKLQPHPTHIAVGALPAPVTHLQGALETIDRNTAFTKDFWFVAQGLRNGLQVYISLFVLHNPNAAYLKMVEHMKRQRNEFDQQGTMRSLNFTDLKMVLGLPTEWPKGELPEQLEHKQLSWSRYWLISQAIKSHRKDVFKDLSYRPYTLDPSETAQEFVEEGVLIGMREYIR